VLVYHLNVLRRDGVSISDKLVEKQSMFSVLVIDSKDGFAEAVKAALTKSVSKVHVTVTTPSEQPPGDFSAVVLEGSTAAEGAPEWIRSFGGRKVIVQNEAQNLVWAEDVAQAAESVQKLAEGQEVHRQKQTRSAWMYVVYVFAALFALQLLLALLIFGIALVTGF